MDLVLLSGTSLKNKEWIEKVEYAVRENFDETRIQYYKHWETGGDDIDFEYEFSKLADTVDGFDKYCIFAKSAGTILTLRGVHEKIINPKRCVFCGTALPFGKRIGQDVDDWLADYTVPTFFIQKSQDPAMGFNDLERYIERSGAKNFEFKEVDGDNHHYGDLKLLKSAIIDFCF